MPLQNGRNKTIWTSSQPTSDNEINTCVDAHCSSTERSSTERSSTERSSTESADGTAETELDNAATKQENGTMDMTPEMLAMLRAVAAEAVAESEKTHRRKLRNWKANRSRQNFGPGCCQSYMAVRDLHGCQ